VVASEVWWNQLGEDKQNQVLKAFREAEAWGFRQQAQAEVSNLERLKAEGVTVTEFDRAQLAPVAERIVGTYTAGNAEIKSFYEQTR
jgi:TRAP-type C4-dicarboxylate transport system substrate-binding protein